MIPKLRLRQADSKINTRTSEVCRIYLAPLEQRSGGLEDGSRSLVSSSNSEHIDTDDSVSSQTDSDDSVDFRVRSPPLRSSQTCWDTSLSIIPSSFPQSPGFRSLSARTTTKSAKRCLSPDSRGCDKTSRYIHDGKLSSNLLFSSRNDSVFVTPKKKFRRAYEEQQQVQGFHSSTDIDSNVREFSANERLPNVKTMPVVDSEIVPSQIDGCKLHRTVNYECQSCLQNVSQRFGWPLDALTSTYSGHHDESEELEKHRTGNTKLLFGILNTEKPSSDTLSDVAGEHSSDEKVASPSSQNDVSDCDPLRLENGLNTPLDLRRQHTEVESLADKGEKITVDSSPMILDFSTHEILRNSESHALTATNQIDEKKSETSLSISNSKQITNSQLKNSVHKLKSTEIRASAVKFINSKCSSSDRSSSVTCDRRGLANERERMRVKHLTGAFQELSDCVAAIASECVDGHETTTVAKFTKVSVLRTAALYIGYLTHLLVEGSGNSEEIAYNKMRLAIADMMSSKNRRFREEGEEKPE